METGMCVNSRNRGGANVGEEVMIRMKSMWKIATAGLLAVLLFAATAGTAAAELPAPNFMPGFPLLAGTQVILMWSPVPGAEKYRVYMDGKVALDGLASFQANMTSPTAGGEHLIEVTAVDAKGVEGKRSAPGKIMIVVLEPPQGIEILTSETAVSLRWSSTRGAVIYDVYRREKGAKEPTLLSSTQESRYTDTTVAKGKEYLYSVKAKDITGKSSVSSEEKSASLQVVSTSTLKSYKLIPRGTKKVASYDLEFYYPQDVAIAKDGRVIVAADVLLLFPKGISATADMTPLLNGQQGFNGVGFGNNGEILAAHSSGDAYVLNPAGDSVLLKMTIPRPDNGVLLYGFAERPKNPYQRSASPIAADIAQDPQGNFYVTDNGNYRLVKFSSDGKFLGTVAYAPKGEDWLVFNPSYLAIDRNGNKFVSQISEIVVFGKDDKRAGLIGALGQGVGSFAKVRGLAFDTEGNIVASDSQNGSVQGFGFSAADKIWEPRFALSDESKTKGAQIASPMGIAISSDGKSLVAAESISKKVSVYELLAQ